MRYMVYLSHPYGGNEENRMDSMMIERGINTVKDDEYIIINPLNDAAFDRFAKWADYDEKSILNYCEGYLSGCKLVVFCPGWEQSNGCRREYEVAKEHGIPRIFLDEKDAEIFRWISCMKLAKEVAA